MLLRDTYDVIFRFSYWNIIVLLSPGQDITAAGMWTLRGWAHLSISMCQLSAAWAAFALFRPMLKYTTLSTSWTTWAGRQQDPTTLTCPQWAHTQQVRTEIRHELSHRCCISAPITYKDDCVLRTRCHTDQVATCFVYVYICVLYVHVLSLRFLSLKTLK